MSDHVVERFPRIRSVMITVMWFFTVAIIAVLGSFFVMRMNLSPPQGQNLALLTEDYLSRVTSDRETSAAACKNVPYGNPPEKPPRVLSDDLGHFVIPPNREGPTLVDVGMFVEAVTEIDPVNNRFTLEGFIDLIWCDPREQFDPAEIGWPQKIYLESEAQHVLTEIWWPDITFPNSDGRRITENSELIILPDGTIDYEEKFKISLEANFDLRQFPFDTQILEIELESLAWTEEFLIFHEEEDKIGFSDRFSLPEWTIIGLETEIKSVKEIRESEPFSEFLVEIEVTREPGYYIFKIMIPLIVLVTLSWSTFWVPQDNIFQRVRLALSGILIVVAFQFAVTRDLPRLPFLTSIDLLFILSFIALAATVVQTLFLYNRWKSDKKEQAQRLEWWSRRLFPVAYLAGVAIMLWVTVG